MNPYQKNKRKILYLLLPAILVIGIYGSQTSSELSGYFKPYKNKNSNDILIISVNGSSYQIGQTVNISGKVYHYDEGTRVVIQLIGPDKTLVKEFNSFVDRYGIFTSFFNISDTVSSGKYILSAYYDGDPHKKQVSLSINIADVQNGITYIAIPQGASSQANRLNFEPIAVNVTQGTRIIFQNNDGTVHTVISGHVNDDGSLALDHHFEGGYIDPGAEIVITPSPGTHNYFCKIHPWLGGSIFVKANPAAVKKPLGKVATKIKPITTPKIKSAITNKTAPKIKSAITNKAPSKPVVKTTTTSKPSTKTKFPISNTILTEIWKSRTDLQKLYPEVAKGHFGNLTKWATTIGWNQDKHLAPLIPHGKVPSYLDNTLVTIWKERKDLQKLYPEVAHGNLSNISKWATSTGWSQDSRLSVLIPPGQKPKY